MSRLMPTLPKGVGGACVHMCFNFCIEHMLCNIPPCIVETSHLLTGFVTTQILGLLQPFPFFCNRSSKNLPLICQFLHTWNSCTRVHAHTRVRLPAFLLCYLGMRYLFLSSCVSLSSCRLETFLVRWKEL